MSGLNKQRFALIICGIGALVLLGMGVMLYREEAKQSPLVTATPAAPVPKGVIGKQPATVPVQTTADRFVDPALPADAKDIQITAGFECSCPDVKMTKLTPSHYAVESTQQVATGGFYLLLRLDGVAGRTVRIDLNGSPFDKWGNAVPQYSYIPDLNHLAGFVSTTRPASGDRAEFEARPRTGDKPALPNTNGQQWHYVSDAWHEEGRLCLVQKFEQDSAYLALRVPCTPAYNEAYLASLQGNLNVEVIQVGKSAEGRPLMIVKVASNPMAKTMRRRPCILIYAREHPDEQDCGWIAQGAVDFLVSDDPRARTMREQADFLIITLLDPDGAASATHENIILSFDAHRETPESRAYAAWFKKWVDNGGHVDVVINLHNPAPSVPFHVACPMMEMKEARLKQCIQLHKQITTNLVASKYLTRVAPWATGVLPRRLSGWLSISYGTLILPYEVNSVTPTQQLNLAQLREIGKVMAYSTWQYLHSNKAKPLFAQVDQLQLRRKKLLSENSDYDSDDAMLVESKCQLALERAAAIAPKQSPTSKAIGSQSSELSN